MSVKHKLDKDGGMERQHVVVLDGFTADENPPADPTADEWESATRDRVIGMIDTGGES